jgi:hypothetical protein
VKCFIAHAILGLTAVALLSMIAVIGWHAMWQAGWREVLRVASIVAAMGVIGWAVFTALNCADEEDQS